MFCPKCGSDLPSGARFCAKCGADISSFTAQAGSAPSAGGVGSKGFAASSNTALHTVRGAAEVVRQMACSPMFLIASALYVLSVLVHLFNIGSSSLSSTIYDVANMLGVGREARYALSEVAGFISFLQVFVGILQILPIIFIAIGLCVIIYQALGKSSSGLGTSGFTLMKAVFGIYAAAYSILLIIVDGFLIYFGGVISENSSRSYYYSNAASTGIATLVITGLVFTLAMAMVISYYSGIYNTLHSAVRAIRKNDYNVKISGYAAVMTFIGAIIVFICSLAVYSGGMKFYGLCDSVASFLFSIMIFRFGSTLKNEAAVGAQVADIMRQAAANTSAQTVASKPSEHSSLDATTDIGSAEKAADSSDSNTKTEG